MRPTPIPRYGLERVVAAGTAFTQGVRRHPIPMRTHFRHSLVVTWACPPADLEQFLVSGLELDTFTDAAGEQHAFAAVALVDLEALRPTGLPRALGSAQVMVGYRVFARMATPAGRTMRGLRILGSQSTSRRAVLGANLTTRYHYEHVRADVTASVTTLRFAVASASGKADTDVTAHLDRSSLPASSPFATPAEARRFAGPLPYTFSPDPQGIVVVKSDRTEWTPTPVEVDVETATFFEQGPWASIPRRLANAFHVADLDYGWRPGVLHRTDGYPTDPQGRA